MKEKIIVLKIQPGRDPEPLEIENTLPEFQKILGGYMETEILDSRTVRITREGSSAGPQILAGYRGEEFTDYLQN